jgi:CRP-like cAMP-binding protein
MSTRAGPKENGDGGPSGAVGLAGNLLFAGLPPTDRSLLGAHARRHRAERGEVLFHPGDPVDAVYWPCSAVVSVIIVTPMGETAEAGVVGREGAIGGLITTARHTAFARAVVQTPGEIAVTSLRAVENAKASSPALVDALARFADCFVAQLLQTMACNSRHALEKRLARWLLALRFHLDDDVIPMTQEYLAALLGVQRTTVTACARELQEQGLISYSRGQIRITDVDGLEHASCRCHLPLQRHYSKVLDGPRR